MIDAQDKSSLVAITQQAGDWRGDMEKAVRYLTVNSDHPSTVYRAAIELYFKNVWGSTAARMQCDAADPEFCPSSRCQERRRAAENAEFEAKLALGSLVVAQ